MNDDNAYCIYIHKHKVNGKVYVGMSNNVARRWKFNGLEYKPSEKEKQNRPFWNAIKKYGFDAFEHIIIETGLTFEEAIEKEKHYIQLYNAIDKKFGYNVSPGGNGGRIYLEHPRGFKGKSQSEFQKQNQKLVWERSLKGKSTNWKNGYPKGMLGKTHSEEYKKWLRNNFVKGKHPSAKKLKATFKDGTTKMFDSKIECAEYFSVSKPTLGKIIKNGIFYEIPKMCTCKERLLKVEGWKFKYIENTEVTNQIA